METAAIIIKNIILIPLVFIWVMGTIMAMYIFLLWNSFDTQAVSNVQSSKIIQEASPETRVLAETIDLRVETLENFLTEKKSPLASSSAVFVEAADMYKFDWRLLPAIAGKESFYGKRIPWDSEKGGSSYNAWGWGVYGQKAIAFTDWNEGIWQVAEGLRHEYFNKELITPQLIMTKFTPSSNGSWATDVNLIMEEISSEIL